jgi:carboxyl-terminal processing protease
MNKPLRAVLLTCVVIALVVVSFGGGFAAGHFIPIGTFAAPVSATNGNQGGTPANLTTLFAPFWTAWKIVHQDYVDQPVNDTQLMQGAISGMMNSLGDAHTIYLSPQNYTEANSQLAGNYAGIGAYVDTTGTVLTITRPMPNSPAEKAGLQAGDQIIAVDGKDMTGMIPDTVRQKVLGPEGTVVKLTILRPGKTAPFDVQITRGIIVVPSVTSKMLANNIAYIQIATFGDGSNTIPNDLHKQLADLLAQSPKGLILDLRYNGGGALSTAIAVASEFVPSGVIVSEKSGTGKITPYDAAPGGLATNKTLPMIVLVNEWSASASEIVSGALQESGRAKLLGVTTYGKGTVQLWINLSNNKNDNQGAVAVTIARWLTPKGYTIDKKGLTPDIVVQMTADDAKAGKDPQLDAAIKQLTTP